MWSKTLIFPYFIHQRDITLFILQLERVSFTFFLDCLQSLSFHQT